MQGNRVIRTVFGLLVASVAFGQQPAAQPTFQAADVHEHVANSSRVSSGGVLRGERYEIRNVSLLDLIFIAWDPDGENILGKVDKQLGLKLETQKRPAPVLVIDHIEQRPADN